MDNYLVLIICTNCDAEVTVTSAKPVGQWVMVCGECESLILVSVTKIRSPIECGDESYR